MNTAPFEFQSRRWATYRIADAERAMLGDAAAELAWRPEHGLVHLRHAAQPLWNALSADTRQHVIDLADGRSSRPELYVVNLPCPTALPPTPVHNRTWMPTTFDGLSELIMMVFSVGLGHPISYLDQRDGNVFHDVFPTRVNAEAVSSQSSRSALGFHTEMFFDPSPPEYLMLHCLRSGAAATRARTGIAALDDIEQRLSENLFGELHRRAYAIDLARLHGSYVHNGLPIEEDHPRPVIPIVNPADRAPFRFEPVLMTPVGTSAAEAMHRVEQLAAATAVEGTLHEGGLLLLDNRRAAHSRSSFVTHFDGRDRWLRRVMVGTDQPLPGEVTLSRHELEIVDPWIRNGALMQTIPYTPTARN